MLLACFLAGCQANSTLLEPEIEFIVPTSCFGKLPSSFTPFSPEEFRQSWSKELYIANAFAREFDFYRAITCYKRALFLMPSQYSERRLQTEYGIVQSYYLGKKYNDAVEVFESSSLHNADNNFPAYKELLVMLYDAYNRKNCVEQAEEIYQRLHEIEPETATKVKLAQNIRTANFDSAITLSQKEACIDPNPLFLSYALEAKSVKKAQWLNAILPGAGYYYVGQKQTALTSFFLNAVFLAASYHFFHNGNIAAGIITSSLEFGWYVGGINGAGLAAKEFNQHLYQNKASDFLRQNQLFPILMLNHAF